jgi:hypothetical protein
MGPLASSASGDPQGHRRGDAGGWMFTKNLNLFYLPVSDSQIHDLHPAFREP